MKRHLNASEIARTFGVDRATVSRWIKKGYLKADKGKQQWKVTLPDYEQFRNHVNH